MTWYQKPPLGTPLDWGNPLNDETVMSLAMNEGHGDKVQDLSLNGNHGTLNNFAFPPTVASGWNPGQTGVGLKFDEIDDYIDCGNAPSIDVGNAFTLSAIVIPENTISIYGIIGMDIPLYLGIVDGSTIRLRHSQIGAGTTNVSCSVPVDKWITITATWDGSNIAVYADGAYLGGAAAAGTITPAVNAVVGNYIAGGGWDFDGYIDQPRIQCRAWSAKEVRDYAINPWQVYLDEND